MTAQPLETVEFPRADPRRDDVNSGEYRGLDVGSRISRNAAPRALRA